MERKILWKSGCYDEIELVYDKASENDAAARLLSELEQGALDEAKAHCGMVRVDGVPLSPERYDAAADEVKEKLMELLGNGGLGAFSSELTDPKIVARLTPQSPQMLCCTAFAILNRLEKLDGALNVLFPKVTLEIQAPLGGKKGLFRIEMLITMLYPWVSVQEVSTNETAVAAAQTQPAAPRPSAPVQPSAAPRPAAPAQPPAASTPAPTKEKKPGFWARLFGRWKKTGENKPEKATEAAASDSKPAAAGQPASAALDAMIGKNREDCNFTAAQQQQWLQVLSRTIPTIMVGGDPLCADYLLQPRMLDEAGNMLNTVGRIAVIVAKMLSITNMEKALNTESTEDMIRSYCILDVYSKLLTAPYCDQINAGKNYIYSVLEKTDLSGAEGKKNELYWAPAIFEGDPLQLSAPDYEIHTFPEAAKLLTQGYALPCAGGLPAQYQFAQKPSGRRMHLRTIRSPGMGLEMVPLYTDLNLMLYLFSPNIRVSVVDFETARRLALQDKNRCAGIVINPGKDNRMIRSDQLEAEG